MWLLIMLDWYRIYILSGGIQRSNTSRYTNFIRKRKATPLSHHVINTIGENTNDEINQNVIINAPRQVISMLVFTAASCVCFIISNKFKVIIVNKSVYNYPTIKQRLWLIATTTRLNNSSRPPPLLKCAF